jgi:uracil-DNA glycosylase
MVYIGNDWDEILKDEFASDYYKSLRNFLKAEYLKHKIYPDMNNIFEAFKLTPFKDVKVVLLGQDPYHNEGQAHGLCFSVKEGMQYPPSLKNIFKELSDDLNIAPVSGCLVNWAKNGVLLLNTSLTVREGQANSHQGKGWELFTDDVIKKLSQKTHPIVFMLWGGNARSKKALIENQNHLILECAHPSPLSAANGFFGCRHFSRANNFLQRHYGRGVDFSV